MCVNIAASRGDRERGTNDGWKKEMKSRNIRRINGKQEKMKVCLTDSIRFPVLTSRQRAEGQIN